MNAPMNAAPLNDATLAWLTPHHLALAATAAAVCVRGAMQSTKSPGSRSSVVSIGSVCGAAGPAFTPLLAAAQGDPESLQAGKYTPTIKLDFGATRKRQHRLTATFFCCSCLWLEIGPPHWCCASTTQGHGRGSAEVSTRPKLPGWPAIMQASASQPHCSSLT
jgi:hypothetical protein